MQKQFEEKGRWYDIEQQAEELVQLEAKDAIPVFLQFLSLDATNEYNVESILRRCRRLDPKAMRETAEQYKDHEPLGIRIQCGIILLQTGSLAEGQTLLGDALSKASGQTMLEDNYTDAVDVLLDEGSAESVEAARQVFLGYNLANASWVRWKVIRKFAAAGLPDGYNFCLKLLSKTDNKLGTASYAEGVSVAEVMACEISDEFNRDNPEVARIRKEANRDGKQMVEPLKKWLKSKIRECKAATE